MRERGQYGSLSVGQIPPRATTVYVEREPSSIGKWIFGAIAVGGAVLWARHQAKQIEQLYKTTGLPQQSFVADLRASTRSLPSRASASLHKLAERVRPKQDQT
jgi:hypothetical protein